MPGLTLAHLLGAAVVITDIRYAVDDLFAVQLQNNAERTMRRWVVRTEVEEHEVLVVVPRFMPHSSGLKVSASISRSCLALVSSNGSNSVARAG
ncbi:Uncharacterised protein [Klebsiella pneumoniae]|uniref:Uncharacterized protein n=1 Tax=Klebsiella pneumoniae TaxID=573 RepID=A0A2X3EVC9_KLEPN|nr:Uncharacterised protein [Klebsiella pneumoniae]